MDIVLATASASILYMMNQKLFMVILVLTIISAALVFIFKSPYKKINLEQMEAGARLNSHIIESLKGIETIKVHASEENSIEKLEIEYIRNLKIAFKEGVLSNVQGSISGAVSTIGNLVLMYIGARMIMDVDITLGSLIELFSGSIKDNITLGKANASYEEIKTACENAGCREFIEKLPVQYNTFLEEAGGGLSGGERQRIALARAFIKKPNFLILDEATSNLDFISEARIFDTLFRKGKNITMLMIAHRLSTIRSCDIIYVMDKGKVVEQGDHETLLKKKGYYYRLYISQVGSLEEKEIIYDENLSKDITETRVEDVLVEGEEYEYS